MLSQRANRTIFKRFYPNINTRVTAPFLVVVMVVAGIGIFTVTRLVAGNIQERLNNQLVDSAQAASNTVSELEKSMLENLRLMVFTEGIDNAILGGDSERLDELIKPIAVNALLDNVIVFDASGQGLVELTRLNEVDLDYINSTPPTEISEWKGVGNIIEGRVDNLGDKYVEIVERGDRIYIYITAPVMDEDNNVIGGITIGNTARRFARQISNQSLAAVALYNPEGKVLGNAFLLVQDEELILAPEQASEISSKVGNTSPVEETTYGNTPYNVLYAPLKLRGESVGLLAVALPNNFIADRISTSRDIFAALFSALFLAIALMGVIISRSISQPVRRLVDTTRAIRQGDLSKRVGLQMPDELGELSVSFDHMTEKLLERNQEINDLYIAQIEQTAQRDAILSNIHDAVVVLDSEGELFLHNPAARKLMDQLSHKPDLYRSFWDICYAARTYQSAQTVTLEDQYFSVVSDLVRIDSGDLLGHVIVFRNITAILEAEFVKNELILQLSHELRTPLTAALGYFNLVKMMVQAEISEQPRQFLDNLGNKLDVLTQMTNQVIDVHSMVTGRFFIRRQLFDFLAMVQKVLAQHHEYIEARNLRCSSSILPTDIWLEGDEGRLRQAIESVLINAYSYILPGGRVGIKVYTFSGKAIVEIADTGVGIPEEELDKVFNLMYRGSSANAGPTDTRGLGLGLYLTKSIVEAHGGNITLHSKVDVGTTVTIEFPILKNR